MNKYKRVRRNMLILAIISIVIFAVIEVFVGREFSFVGNLLIYFAIASVVFFIGTMILEVNDPIYSKFVKGAKITWTIILCSVFAFGFAVNVACGIEDMKEDARKRELAKNACIVSGCDYTRLSGKNYCSKHSEYYSRKKSSGSSTTNSNSSSSKHSYSTSYSYDFDPDDYDSAEDYADDAWGDFDDWDSAYEFWENY